LKKYLKFKTISSPPFFEPNDSHNSYQDYESYFDTYLDYLKKENPNNDEYSNNGKNILSFQNSFNEELNEISFSNLNEKEDYSFDLNISSINHDDIKEFQEYSENEIPKDNEAPESKDSHYTETEKLVYDIFILPLFFAQNQLVEKYIYIKFKKKEKFIKNAYLLKRIYLKNAFLTNLNINTFHLIFSIKKRLLFLFILKSKKFALLSRNQK